MSPTTGSERRKRTLRVNAEVQSGAFTLIELVTVCAVLALGALTLLPALGRSRPDSNPLRCLNNLRQLGNAWVMYAEDNQGKLVYNPDGAGVGRTFDQPSWAGGWLDFTTSPDNTNTALLVDHNRYPFSAFLGPYVRTPAPFKCPADRSTTVIGGQRFARARSLSMNGWVGQKARGWFTSGGFQIYGKTSDITKLTPAGLFVFTEERPDSINDGVFFTQPSYSGPNYTIIDYPAAYHLDACTFSFADGHSEIHRWRDPRTMPVLRPGQLLTFNVSTPGNPDVFWLITHSTSRP